MISLPPSSPRIRTRTVLFAILSLAQAALLSGCLESSYSLDPKSPLPQRFASDPKVKQWKNVRVYYELWDDLSDENLTVEADLWSGPFRHRHASGYSVGLPSSPNGPDLIFVLDGIRDDYVVRYNRSTGQETLFVVPPKIAVNIHRGKS